MATQTKLEPWQIEDAQRLDALFKTRARLNQTDFGDHYGIGTQGMVWQYLSARRGLNIKAAAAFSRGLGVPIDEFSPTLATQIEQAAERIETAMNAWPFISIDQSKVRQLDGSRRAQLEAAILIAAAQVGLDIKKE
ncbi:helix-turn-helix domain-containing protein [Candidimonas humi]|uniref:Helix-turn-helix domain-containing protein n=1 Tax=Candidimonas humi TaxID=683355 RepID=A0ABV8NUN0_9BURK|nr:helix-turn-helix transcriptional regulator [Candidimonas humi]MBV6304904.1 helix-turn-helix domain-containing protein [Candidimonas humi]